MVVASTLSSLSTTTTRLDVSYDTYQGWYLYILLLIETSLTLHFYYLVQFPRITITELRNVLSKSNKAFHDDKATQECDLSKIPAKMYCAQVKTLINPSSKSKKFYKDKYQTLETSNGGKSVKFGIQDTFEHVPNVKVALLVSNAVLHISSREYEKNSCSIALLDGPFWYDFCSSCMDSPEIDELKTQVQSYWKQHGPCLNSKRPATATSSSNDEVGPSPSKRQNRIYQQLSPQYKRIVDQKLDQTIEAVEKLSKKNVSPETCKLAMSI